MKRGLRPGSNGRTVGNSEEEFSSWGKERGEGPGPPLSGAVGEKYGPFRPVSCKVVQGEGIEVTRSSPQTRERKKSHESCVFKERLHLHGKRQKRGKKKEENSLLPDMKKKRRKREISGGKKETHPL